MYELKSIKNNHYPCFAVWILGEDEWEENIMDRH